MVFFLMSLICNNSGNYGHISVTFGTWSQETVRNNSAPVSSVALVTVIDVLVW